MPETALAGFPDASEYVPYFGRYVSLIQSDDQSDDQGNDMRDDIISVLERQIPHTVALLSKLPETAGDFRYAPGKWSLKEVVGHLADTERVMAYRALRISRGDQTPMEGFEQDDYVRDGPFAHCRLQDLVEEYAQVRRASVLLFRPLQAHEWLRRGTASGNGFTVRALAYLMAGHELHHRRVIEENYLKNMPA